MDRIEVPTKQVQHIIRATCDNYTKRTVYIEARTEVEMYQLNWEGGSRNQYRGCTLDGRITGSADKYNQIAPWDPRQIYGERAKVAIPPGLVLVRSGYFCGKQSKAVIYVNPADMPKYIKSAYQGSI